jgi:hypothetical protein
LCIDNHGVKWNFLCQSNATTIERISNHCICLMITTIMNLQFMFLDLYKSINIA